MSSESERAEPVAGAIRASRRLLENPYAYLDDAGNFSSAPQPIPDPTGELSSFSEQKPLKHQQHSALAKNSVRYSNRELEKKAKAVQKIFRVEK